MESKHLQLKAFFKPEELEWRIQSSGFTRQGEPWAKVLCYTQARAVQQRLDDVFGVMRWKTRYTFERGGILCYLSAKDEVTGEWVEKVDGASETDIEPFKGGISDSFKRVASSGYGIGRYLYKLDTVFAVCIVEKPSDPRGWNYANVKVKEKDKEGKLTEVRKVFYWENPELSVEFLPKKEDKK